MSIITTSYFTANLDLPGRNAVGLSENLTLYISRYEPIYLRGVLGYSLYKLLMTAYDASVAATPTPLPQRWADLLNGVEYDVSDITYKWDGLRNSTLLTSPIANYIYFTFRRDTETRTGNVGENKPNAQNADSVTPNRKLVFAWNDMVHQNWQLKHYLDNNTATFPEWDTAEIDMFFFTRINDLGI
jgi:hypothetical protein